MKHILLSALIVISSQFPALSRDFKEPEAAYDPLSWQEGTQILANYVYGDTKTDFHSFNDGDYDNFDVRAFSAFNIVSIESIFALNGYWCTYLLIGPVASTETPATVAPFWMNAVQFEYGLTAAFDAAFFHLLLEYSRTSQHPIEGRPALSQATTDALKTGFTVPTLNLDVNTALDFSFRTGFVDLFDFWQSPVPKPRTLWVFSPNLSVCYRFDDFVSLYAECGPDFLVLRKGGFDAEILLETGVRFGGDRANLRIYIEYFHSGDTEELLGTAAPVDLFGWGFQFSTAYRNQCNS